MFRKIFYVLLVLALVAIAAFALWKNSGSEKEMQKLRAQMYDLQKQVEKQNLAKAEEKQSVEVKEEVKEEKEERKILSEALTAPSQTPPSVVRPASAEAKSTIISVADSNDFAQSLADIQEEVKEQAMKETINDVAEAITNDSKAIDMSEVDAMIKEAEEKLVAQYGAQILEKEEKSAKVVETVKEEAEETVEEVKVVSSPSWQDENALPGSVPVVSIDENATRNLNNTPTKIQNTYISSKGDIQPVHGDAPLPPSQPSWTQSSEKTTEPVVQRTTSLRPASEVIVPVTAKEEVEKEMKAEELRRRPPENVRRIPKKNYNALGKRTMADVMKEGL